MSSIHTKAKLQIANRRGQSETAKSRYLASLPVADGKPPLPKFKMAHVTRKQSKAADAGSRNYTLNCERRMAQFKNDFRRLFIG